MKVIRATQVLKLYDTHMIPTAKVTVEETVLNLQLGRYRLMSDVTESPRVQVEGNAASTQAPESVRKI